MSKRMSAAERKRSIIDVAVGQFAANGYDGTVMRNISDEAGVNEALLYRHFPNKEALFNAALGSMIALLKERTLFTQLAQRGLEAEALALFAESVLKFFGENPRLTHMLLYSGLQKHDLAAQFFDSTSKPTIEAISGFIKSGQKRGELRDDIDPFIGALAYVGAVIFMNLAQSVFQHELFRSVDTKEFAQALSKIYLRGLSVA